MVEEFFFWIKFNKKINIEKIKDKMCNFFGAAGTV